MWEFVAILRYWPAVNSHVEEGWNISTVALRVAEGDEKGA
jgi:hypothetical protein